MKPITICRIASTANCILLAALAVAWAPAANADDEGIGTQALAKQAQNPIANLISIPLQSNTNFGLGATHGTQEVLLLQPVVPFPLSGDWHLITRWIVPLIREPALSPGTDSTFGTGDINPSAFITHFDGDLTWGAGPTLVLPTASDRVLGQGRWSAGPTAVVLYTPGKWVVGALANNVWSFAGAGDHRPMVNQALIQPFANYNLTRGWYITSSPVITSNWRADPTNRWTVPVGGGIGRLVRFDGVPINSYVQVFDNVVKPAGGAVWTLRLQVQVLLPK